MSYRGKRKLTREERACVLKQGGNPKDYMFAYDINESYFMAIHKETGVERTFDKYRKAKNRWDY